MRPCRRRPACNSWQPGSPISISRVHCACRSRPGTKDHGRTSSVCPTLDAFDSGESFPCPSREVDDAVMFVRCPVLEDKGPGAPSVCAAGPALDWREGCEPP